jgi:protein-tyrosine kinase
MNDHTPRRYRGSLLERAAEQYHFNAPPPRAQPASAPVAQPAPAPVFAEAPVEGPVLRRGFAAEETPPRETGRRSAPIDRASLTRLGMLVPGGPVTPLAEEFRLVKRQLLLTARAVAGADAQRARMILVCSANPDEGKTFCAINLAISMAAEKDAEILLVDADFAKPDILERLGLPQGPGLLDALAGQVNVEDCILDTDVPQLCVLPAGAKSISDTELLASDRARQILDGLAAANPRRIVIFDSPPALAASPAAVLALHAGQVLLVVRADRTSESDLREATAMLDGCEHIQLLLNAVSFQPGGRRFGYYGETGK